jgi:serine/threonine protein kinase
MKSGRVVTRYVFEMAEGTLCNLMRNKDDEPLPSDVLDKNLHESLKICLDTLEGLAHLHSRGFVHMDIQPKNILCVMGQGKLSDFETLRHVQESFLPGGTFPYTAPELFHQMDSLPHNDPSMDMFSFGVMLLEVLSPTLGGNMHDICIGACPMCREPDEGPADTHEQTRVKIEEIQEVLRKKGEPWTLVADLIDIDPSRRPTSAETRDRFGRALQTLPRQEFRYHTATAR